MEKKRSFARTDLDFYGASISENQREVHETWGFHRAIFQQNVAKGKR